MSDSRLEKFIYAICSMEVSDLPAPLSRIEKLWNCLITGETPDFEPQSRNERYLMAMLGLYELENLPAPMSRGEKLLYKIAMGETDLSDIPAYLSRYEELLGYLAENGGVGDFEYILQTLNQRLSTLYSTKERPMQQAVIKGDTLVNELPRPSLKNTMNNVGMQKLNHGYDTVNAVDGEFKSAILSGQTLVNVLSISNVSIRNSSVYSYNYNITPQVGEKYLIKIKINSVGVTTNTNPVKIQPCDGTGGGYFNITEKEYCVGNEITKIFTIIDGNNITNGIFIVWCRELSSGEFNADIIMIKYQEGMENWDIPYFTGIQSVKMPVLTTTGKNLFDGKNMSNGYYTVDGGINNINHENSLSDYIKVEPSSSYAYKCFSEDQGSNYGEFAFFDENKNFINVLHAHHTSDTCIITPDNCHYLRVWNNQYINNGEIHPNAMLVKTTNLPSTLIYEPYHSNTLTTNEEIIIRSLPNGVCDTFNALTGVYTQRIGDDIFIGASNEEWTSPSIYYTGDAISFRIKRQTKPAAGTAIPSDIICDKFKISTPRNAWGNDNYDGEGVSHGTAEGDGIDVRILKSKLSAANIQGFKEWLSENPIRVQYELIEPITKTINTTITDQDGATQTKLHSFNDGHLSVSSQGLLPSAVNYEVPTNNSYYLPDMLTLGAQYTARGSVDCHATIDGKLLALGKNGTFTTPSSLTNRLMVLDAPVDDLMFIKGDQTAKDFGYFEGMKSVEMNSIQVTGKNLFDIEKFGMYDENNYNQTYNPFGFWSFKLTLEPNTTYTFSRKNNEGYATGTHIKINTKHDYKDAIWFVANHAVNENKQSMKLTTDSTGNIYIFTNSRMDLVRKALDLCEFIQIEKGTVAAPYEPYKSNILTVNEEVTLRGVGNVKDELDCLTGEMTQRIGEVVLDGSENEWEDYNNNSFVLRGRYFTDSANSNSTAVKIAICNRFNWGDGDSLNTFRIHNSGGVLWSMFSKASENQTLDEFKQWLSQNPIAVQYQLATESVKTVDLTTVNQDGQPTKLKTFNDISYVEIKADNLIPSVDVEVATKISETLSTLDPQHHDISETQNELGQTIEEQTENTDATMMATTEIYEQTL